MITTLIVAISNNGSWLHHQRQRRSSAGCLHHLSTCVLSQQQTQLVQALVLFASPPIYNHCTFTAANTAGSSLGTICFSANLRSVSVIARLIPEPNLTARLRTTTRTRMRTRRRNLSYRMVRIATCELLYRTKSVRNKSPNCSLWPRLSSRIASFKLSHGDRTNVDLYDAAEMCFLLRLSYCVSVCVDLLSRKCSILTRRIQNDILCRTLTNLYHGTGTGWILRRSENFEVRNDTTPILTFGYTLPIKLHPCSHQTCYHVQ